MAVHSYIIISGVPTYLPSRRVSLPVYHLDSCCLYWRLRQHIISDARGRSEPCLCLCKDAPRRQKGTNDLLTLRTNSVERYPHLHTIHGECNIIVPHKQEQNGATNFFRRFFYNDPQPQRCKRYEIHTLLDGFQRGRWDFQGRSIFRSHDTKLFEPWQSVVQ